MLTVEVFPVEPYRWIAVIEAPQGSFSTETQVASAVGAEVRASIQAVLGLVEPAFELVDDLGEPWSPSAGPAQMERLEVGFDKQSLLPAPLRWWRRRPAWFGDCPACGHDWREHVAADGECGECRYEIEHDEPEAPTLACRTMPSAELRLATAAKRCRRSR